ncbi:MAG: L-seryl-tRNA(Sec) selenium transferase [Phycisphaerae bacterium]
MSADNAASNSLRRIPSVSWLFEQTPIAQICDEYPRTRVKAAIDAVLDEYRDLIRSGDAIDFDLREFALDVRESLQRSERRTLRRVINATGVVLHTGLGRAPLPRQAIDAIIDVASGYCNLEIDLETGSRGDRQSAVCELLCELTGAEDALVVNNNAAGSFLALNTLARGREAIISRGELVEIGGSYRIPDIMATAQCKMVEVGTTNRTHLYDYERAITRETTAIVRVHPSNYVVSGFVTRPTLETLAALVADTNESRASNRGNADDSDEEEKSAADGDQVYLIDDLGSGLLEISFVAQEEYENGSGVAEDAEELHGAAEEDCDDVEFEDEDNEEDAYVDEDEDDGAEDGDEAIDDDAESNLARPAPARRIDEPTVADSLASGADVVLFSGDKILGGPQAGIVLGSADVIAKMRRNPLMRTFRPGKLTLAALEATLMLYRDPEQVAEQVPALRFLTRDLAEIEEIAERLESAIAARSQEQVEVEIVEDQTFAGGGALPALSLPTRTVVVQPENITAQDVAAALRDRDVPIVCRVRRDALLFDCRTLVESDIDEIAMALGEET